MRYHHFLFAASLFGTSIAVHADGNTQAKTGFVYGIGANYSQEIYKGYSARFIPIPVIGYKGEKLNVFGPFVSYTLLSADNVKVAFELAPRFQGFDESDSDFFIGMSKRKDSLDAGVSIEYQYGQWKTKLTSLFDVLDNSGGVEVASTVAYTLRFGPIFVEPNVSLVYESSDLVNYYYGVSELESMENRPYFKGDSGFNVSTGVSVATPIFLGGFTRLSINNQWFGSHITDSPLVESNYQLSVNFLFSKAF